MEEKFFYENDVKVTKLQTVLKSFTPWVRRLPA